MLSYSEQHFLLQPHHANIFANDLHKIAFYRVFIAFDNATNLSLRLDKFWTVY